MSLRAAKLKQLAPALSNLLHRLIPELRQNRMERLMRIVNEVVKAATPAQRR
jgi:hypothetical protein